MPPPPILLTGTRRATMSAPVSEASTQEDLAVEDMGFDVFDMFDELDEDNGKRPAEVSAAAQAALGK